MVGTQRLTLERICGGGCGTRCLGVAEYQGLEGAFARRAITERAKGIQMERHSVDEKRAFEMLRDEARRSNRKVIEVAEAVTVSVNLLPKSQVD